MSILSGVFDQMVKIRMEFGQARRRMYPEGKKNGEAGSKRNRKILQRGRKETCLVVEEGLDKGLGGTGSSTSLALIRPDGIKRIDSAGS